MTGRITANYCCVPPQLTRQSQLLETDTLRDTDLNLTQPSDTFRTTQQRFAQPTAFRTTNYQRYVSGVIKVGETNNSLKH